MPAGVVQATITADLGPGLTATGLVLSNVSNMNFRFVDGAFDVYQSDPPKMTSFVYSDVTTVTWTPSARTVVITN